MDRSDLLYDFKTDPFNHQKEAYEKHAFDNFFALYMEQGCGKSKTAIDIACESYKHNLIEMVIVIAPNGVHEQWQEEQIPEHSSVENDTFLWDSSLTSRKWYSASAMKFIKSEGKLKWLMMNVEAFSSGDWKKEGSAKWRNFLSKLLSKHTAFVIVDESTRIKNPDAKRTKNIISMGQDEHIVKKSILTGTPVTNSPFDLWSQFEFLNPGFWGCNFFVFKKRHGIMVTDVNPSNGRRFQRTLGEKEFTMLEKYIPSEHDNETVAAMVGISEKDVAYIRSTGQISTYKRLDEIKTKIDPFTFTVKKEDCLDLPPKIFETVLVDMNAEQATIYNNLKKELIAIYDGKELTVMNKVSLTIRLMQITGGFFPYSNKDVDDMFFDILADIENVSINDITKHEPIQIGSKNPKVERVINELDEVGEERIIIWANFIAEIDNLYTVITKKYPEWRVERYYGPTPNHERSQIKRDFRDGHIKILIANRTGSTGLNLQRSNFQIFYSNDYSLEHRLQKEDRSHRIGQKWPVLYKDFVMRGTIDEKIMVVLREKKDILEFFRSKPLREII